MSNVDSLLADARNYTSGLINQASGAMAAAIDQASAIGYTIPGVPAPKQPTPPPLSVTLTAPALPDVTMTLPSAPSSALTFQDIPSVQPGTAPTFDAKLQSVTLPSQPTSPPGFDASTPVLSYIQFPDPPAELLNPVIGAPVLPDRAEPEKPTTVIPTFEVAVPADNTVAPTGLANTFATTYSGASASTIAMVNGFIDSMLAKVNPQYSAQMARIETQLGKYLDGGTALNPTVENAIYERSRGKNDAEARRNRDAAYNDAADRGFTLPDGALMSAVLQARQAGADNNARAAVEITVMQAEMEQRNLQFAVTTSSNLRTMMVNATLSYMNGLVSLNGQAIEYARSILNAVVETYNISVTAYRTRLEAYRAQAAVFETQLRAALAGIELYRAEVAALEAMVTVDRTRIDVYRARIDILQAEANVYRSQVEAVQGRVNLENAKLLLFRSQVEAYAAQVQAKNAEWQGYAAAVEGQVAQTRAFAAQAEAYSAQVQGYKTAVDAQVATVQAMATSNEAHSRSFAAQWQAYQIAVGAVGEVARTKLENSRQTIMAFQATATAAVAQAQVAAEYYRASAMIGVEDARLKLQAQVDGAANQRAYGDTLARLGTANAQIYSGLAASAMSGMNTLAADVLNEGG